MAKPLLAQKRFYLTYAIYWVLWIVIETNVLQWYGMPGLQSLYDSLITFVLLTVVCVLVCNILTYYEPSRDVILYLSVLAVVSTLVWGFVDRAILQINRAAEDAVGAACPIFLDAIRQMTIADALAIIRGNQTAATD